LKDEALDRTVWRTRFGRGYGPVVRQTTEWMKKVIRKLGMRSHYFVSHIVFCVATLCVDWYVRTHVSKKCTDCVFRWPQHDVTNQNNCYSHQNLKLYSVSRCSCAVRKLNIRTCNYSVILRTVLLISVYHCREGA
jgi:hypothetical protein